MGWWGMGGVICLGGEFWVYHIESSSRVVKIVIGLI